jgi:ribosome-binding protein aMBF1 (putative translation factor)
MMAAWDRRPGETDAARHAFLTYRDYLPTQRSLPRLASDLIAETPAKDRTTDSVQRQVERWSSQHDWQTRVRAWDAEVEQRTQEAQLDSIIEVRRRHAKAAQTIIDIVALPAYELASRLANDPTLLADMATKDLYAYTLKAARVLPAIMQIELQARGEQSHTQESSRECIGLTDEHILELWTVLEELGISPTPPD